LREDRFAGSFGHATSQRNMNGLEVTAAIPGEVPLSGACGWIQLLELEDRKLDRSGEVLAACGPIELVKDAGFSLPMPLATYFSSTSAYTFSGTW